MGGAFFSEGCATSCLPKFTGEGAKKGFEGYLRSQLPSLKDDSEGTFILLPSRNWWDGYYNENLDK